MALPVLECGLVVSYSYLWRHESETGKMEGSKNRPCIIVAIVSKEGGKKLATVAPITHSLPADLTVAIEISQRIKRYLGLDGERSWVILDDFNDFIWPGYDLRLVLRKPGHYDYGIMPPALFDQIMTRIFEIQREGRTFSASRDE